ncbi:MAG: MATE family efflux transporter [Lachnospiraceae bacterium]|nr:MATE family efflux transporter [Lachnospiraceae bacterium]
MPQTTRKTFREKFLGDKAFYRLVLAVGLPIIIQNGISTFVNMLDNIMVGSLGTEEMSGVSVINQLYFVYMLCIFGGMGGIGIFTAQYFGKNDLEGVRKTFRVKLLLGTFLSLTAAAVFWFFGDPLIMLYLHEDGSSDLQSTLGFARQYLNILILSIPAFCAMQLYNTTQRECSETMLPMKAGIAAVSVNLLFNYLLIYGSLGFPKLGVRGAAIATVLSRYVEAGIVVIRTHMRKNRNPWIIGVYRYFRLPKETFLFLRRGLPLLVNEALWSTGMATLNQCYSTRGIAVFAGLNIALTLNNFLDIVFMTLGNATGIIIGQLLGAGKLEEAKDKDTKMFFFAILVSIASAIVMIGAAFFFPNLYNTSAEAKFAAMQFIIAFACAFPKNAFLQAAYFTLRAGGKTILTFIYDAGAVWAVSIPVALLLSRLTDMSALWIFICVSIADLAKVTLGYIWVKKNIWLNNLVGKN